MRWNFRKMVLAAGLLSLGLALKTSPALADDCASNSWDNQGNCIDNSSCPSNSWDNQGNCIDNSADSNDGYYPTLVTGNTSAQPGGMIVNFGNVSSFNGGEDTMDAAKKPAGPPSWTCICSNGHSMNSRNVETAINACETYGGGWGGPGTSCYGDR